MTSRCPPFAFVELVSPYNKKNITRWLEDMNFMFSWQEQYLSRSLRSLVRYCSCHSNIKFISSRHRVISSIYQCDSKTCFKFAETNTQQPLKGHVTFIKTYMTNLIEATQNSLTAPFNNMRTLKFKDQRTIRFSLPSIKCSATPPSFRLQPSAR